MDCDGIIFDVNAAKTEAFVQAVADYPVEARQALARHHEAHGGLSRYAKFRHFFSTIHPVDDPEPHVARALARFGAITSRAYDALTPRREALAVCDALGGPRRVFVVSGSDQRELRSVFRDHGIAERFAAVLGSPTEKRQHMASILGERAIDGGLALMVGDGRTDFEAARELNIPFVFLAEMSEWSEARALLAAAVEQRRAFIADHWATLLSWTEPC